MKAIRFAGCAFAAALAGAAMPAAAQAKAQNVPVMPPPPIAAPAPTIAIAPARLAAATRLMQAMHLEKQFDQIFNTMLPVMTENVITTLGHDARVAPKIRDAFTDAAQLPAVRKILGEEVMCSFHARYDRMTEMSVREYALAFTEDELDGLTAFYSTPLGAKVLKLMPEIQQKLMPMGMAIGVEAGREAIPRALHRIVPDAPLPGA